MCLRSGSKSGEVEEEEELGESGETIECPRAFSFASRRIPSE